MNRFCRCFLWLARIGDGFVTHLLFRVYILAVDPAWTASPPYSTAELAILQRIEAEIAKRKQRAGPSPQTLRDVNKLANFIGLLLLAAFASSCSDRCPRDSTAAAAAADSIVAADLIDSIYVAEFDSILAADSIRSDAALAVYDSMLAVYDSIFSADMGLILSADSIRRVGIRERLQTTKPH